MSGFALSAFDPCTTIGGDGAGGFALRTSMAGVVSGTASELGGGKFANGAVTAAFVHMFNAEGIFKSYKYRIDSGHNGGQEHVHWDKKNVDSLKNAQNIDGTVRHGNKSMPNSLKKHLNKVCVSY